MISISLLLFITYVLSNPTIQLSPLSIRIPGQETFKLKFPNSIEFFTINNKITISTTSPDPIPQQFVLNLYNAQVSTTIPFVFKDNSFALTIDLNDAKLKEALHQEPGVYSLTLFASHRDSVQPLEYPLGKLKLDFTPTVSTSSKKADDVIFEPLPEIRHVFRADPKEPNGLLSGLFSILLIALWIPLLTFYKSEKVNFKDLSLPGLKISGSLFMVLLGVNVYLLYLYWVKLNLFEFLGYAFVLSLLTIVVGRQVLVVRHAKRVPFPSKE